MNISPQLEQLENAQLVHCLAAGEATYIFKHALTQDAAYQSVLRKQRSEIHRGVAEAYETLYAGQLNEFAALLAYHCAEAGDDAKTMAYSIQAAETEMRIYAYPEARVHFARALDAFKRLPATEEHIRRHVDAIFRYVEAAWGAFVPEELFGLVSEAETLARSLGDPLRLAQIHTTLIGFYLARNDNREVIRYARQVIEEASGLADKTLVATPSAQLGMALVVQGHFQDAQPYLVQAITLLEETPDRWEWFSPVGCLGVRFAMQGQVAAGLAEGQRALVRMEATQNHFGITLCHTWLLAIYLERADMTQLLEESERTVEVAVKADMAVYASIGLGFKALAQSRLGQHQDAEKSMAEARDVGARVGGRFMMSDWIAAVNAELAYRAGTWEEAVVRAEQSITMAQSVGGIFAEGWAHRVWAQALAQSQPTLRDQVEEHLGESLQLFEEGDARLESARTHIAWGKVLCEFGDRKSAGEHFEKAVAQFEASGLTRELEETRTLLSEAEIAR